MKWLGDLAHYVLGAYWAAKSGDSSARKVVAQWELGKKAAGVEGNDRVKQILRDADAGKYPRPRGRPRATEDEDIRWVDNEVIPHFIAEAKKRGSRSPVYDGMYLAAKWFGYSDKVNPPAKPKSDLMMAIDKWMGRRRRGKKRAN